MAEVRKYRVWCTTEAAYQYTWRDDVQGAPSLCPNDSAHTLDASKTAVVETAGVAAPTKDDGTPFIAVAPAKPGSPLFPIGIAKKVTLPQADPVNIDLTMTEVRYLNGAHGEVWGDFIPGEDGDYIEFFISVKVEKSDHSLARRLQRCRWAVNCALFFMLRGRVEW